jgi:parvulin-like peptidyl-prolyl isomerase
MLSCYGLYAQKPDPKAIVGTIQDKSYTYEEYSKILENYFNYWKSTSQRKLGTEDAAKLNDQCWEELIGRYVYDAEISSRKLVISNSELDREIRKNPPAGVKTIDALMTNNKFDKAKYIEALDGNPEFKKNVMDFTRETYKYSKLFEVIKAGVNVDADSVKNVWLKDHDSAEAKIIYFDPKKLLNISATDAEALEFYNQNKDSYRKDDGRTYNYLHFSKTPGAADSLTVKTMVDSLYQYLLGGGDFAEAARTYSKDPGSAPNGGDLGFFKRGAMVPEFENASFSTPVMGIAPPVISRFGWHIIQVLDKRTDSSGAEEVQARHILIKVDVSEDRQKAIKNETALLYRTAEITGLIPAAAKYDMTVQKSEPFQMKDRYIKGIGGDANLISFAFNNPKETLAKLYTAPNGDIYICEIADSLNVFYTPFESEKAALLKRTTNQKRVTAMTKIAEDFVINNQPADYLKAAASDSLIVIDVPDLKIDTSVSPIGKIETLNRAILDLNTGQNTGLIVNNDNRFLAIVTDRKLPDLKLWEKEKSALVKKAKEDLQQKHLNEWYYAQKNKLKIDDKRKDFYDLASRQPQSIQLSPN